MVQSGSAFAVVPNRFDRASLHRRPALGFFLRRRRLLKDIGVTSIVMAFEIGRGSLTAQIAVDALVIDVECSGRVFRIFIRNVGHRLSFVSCTPAQIISAGSASSARLSKAHAFEKNRPRNYAWQAISKELSLERNR
jgi:hypothetical protein